ncbi:hypothetical protein KZX06_09700 [Micrococcus sp. EYE_162]|uniref:hypothetical protein n=1 Tax=Micrococcus sp. EYE_162 TaxID=2853450 RepID=UPI0020039D1E|nr:hypothetical protein [Micrococcus sp. EYE_162]MCK6096200.1 hypothetical protein [Micrococcus sp. EYE_212]MCK6172291.1 hypothetical protein [Micrococcus sp. EYE_162]
MEFLLSAGNGVHEAIQRVGAPSLGALHKRLQRAGRHDLAERVRRWDREAADYRKAA